jgi:DNA-binding transcriptional ArsR family regulator
MWRRVAARREEALALLRQLRCATATQLGRRLGVSHMQAAYALKMLEREGGIISYKIGRLRVWCVPQLDNGEVYTAVSPCFKYAETALKKLLEGARGSIYMLAPSDLIRAMAELYRRDCASAIGRAYLLSAAKTWLEGRLDGAILSTERRRSWKNVLYIIDVKKAREKLAAAYV